MNPRFAKRRGMRKVVSRGELSWRLECGHEHFPKSTKNTMNRPDYVVCLVCLVCRREAKRG